MRSPLATCVLVTLATRLAAVLAWPTPPSWDGHYYARLAARLAAGEGYTDALATGSTPTAFWPPGLPFALAPLLRLGASPRVAAAGVNLAAATLACVAVYAFAARRGGPALGRRAAMIYALYPGLILWSTAAMTETLTGALLAIALLISLRRNAFCAGVSLGLAALTRPPSLLLVAAPWIEGRGAKSVALCALGAALLVLPWTARNASALDEVALISTNGGSNLLIGARSSDGGYHRVHRAHPSCDRAAGEVARDRCWRGLAVSTLRAHPLAWSARSALRLARTFALETDPAAHLAWSRRPPPPALRVTLGALCTLAWWALGLRFALRARRDADARAPLFAVALTALTHAVFLGADRYHLVLVPLLCPLAAERAR